MSSIVRRVESAKDSDTREGREGEKRHSGKRGPTLYGGALRMKNAAGSKAP